MSAGWFSAKLHELQELMKARFPEAMVQALMPGCISGAKHYRIAIDAENISLRR